MVSGLIVLIFVSHKLLINEACIFNVSLVGMRTRGKANVGVWTWIFGPFVARGPEKIFTFN